MSRALLCVVCGLALMGGAFAETDYDATADDLNEGARLFKNGPNEYTFHWWERAGWTYFLQTSVDLVDWNYVPDNIVTGNNAPDEITLTLPTDDRLFLRVVRWPVSVLYPNGADFDHEKVSNINELSIGTDPLLLDPVLPFPDWDGDGMSDDWETQYGLDPHNYADGDPPDGDPVADLDHDGHLNINEFLDGPFGSDPTDYYNGIGYPTIVSIGWPDPPPTDEPGTLLAQPFEVVVTNGAGPVNGARVTFYTQGADAGQISLSSDGTDPGTIRQRLTDSEGHAHVYFKHPSENPPVPTLRAITAKVGSAVPGGNGPVAVVLATTQFDYHYPENTVGKNATDAIDTRIAATNLTEDFKSIFSTQNHGSSGFPPVSPAYIRNTSSWCYDLRQAMTCISPWNFDWHNLFAGTAITAQHFVNAKHVALPVGNAIRFITANAGANNAEEVVTRTIIGRYDHPVGDVTVYTLNSPLPTTITPCKVLPADYENRLSYLENGRPPVMVLDQEEKALVSELRGLGALATFARPGLHRNRIDFYKALIPGDSGNPAFLIIKPPPPNTGPETLVLLTTITHGYGNEDGTFVTNLINPTLNEMIVAADADTANHSPFIPITTGMTVQTIDLSGFDTFTPP